jgi:hypothetical protein
MQHITIKDRLGSCCLVSKRLHAAAVAATEQLSLTAADSTRTESVLNWISHYGQHLTSPSFDKLAHPVWQLQCRHLQDLQLLSCQVQLGAAADGQQGVIQGCTKLTCLWLHSELLDSPDGAVLDGLSSLVHLQSLILQPATGRSIGGLPIAALPRLQHLTCLGLQCLSRSNLLQLSDLTSLQWLHFRAGDVPVRPSRVPGLVLPASLETPILS